MCQRPLSQYPSWIVKEIWDRPLLHARKGRATFSLNTGEHVFSGAQSSLSYSHVLVRTMTRIATFFVVERARHVGCAETRYGASRSMLRIGEARGRGAPAQRKGAAATIGEIGRRKVCVFLPTWLEFQANGRARGLEGTRLSVSAPRRRGVRPTVSNGEQPRYELHSAAPAPVPRPTANMVGSRGTRQEQITEAPSRRCGPVPSPSPLSVR